MIYPTIEDAIGKTPLVALQRLGATDSAAHGNVILGKLEGNNPAGSVTDRPALSMIRRAEERGEIKPGGPHVYRYANRIPLLYDEGSDVVIKVVNDTDWGRYKVKGEPPFIIVSHICSTRIPYKTAGKENVADRPEIERELI